MDLHQKGMCCIKMENVDTIIGSTINTIMMAYTIAQPLKHQGAPCQLQITSF